MDLPLGDHPFLVGFQRALALGVAMVPVWLLVVDAGVRDPLRSGFAAAAGVGFADTAVAAMAVLIGETLQVLIDAHQRPIAVVAGSVLFAVALLGIVQARRLARRDPGSAGPLAPRPLAAFARLFVITAVHPTTVLYYFTWYRFPGAPYAAGRSGTGVLFVGGVATASLAWHGFVAGAAAWLRERVPPWTRCALAIVGNLLIAASAALLVLA